MQFRCSGLAVLPRRVANWAVNVPLKYYQLDVRCSTTLGCSAYSTPHRNGVRSFTMAHRSVAKLIRFSEMKIAVEPSGARAHVSLPGIPLEYFDRSGNWNVSKLQALLTMVRFYVYHSPNAETGSTFLEYDKLTDGCYTFMASTKTEISKDLYDLLDSEAKPSLAVSVHLGYVGTSSLNSVAHLYCDDSRKVYVKNTNQVVTVDKATRKPMPLPDWWKNKYKSCVEGNERLIVPPTAVPEDAYRFSMRTLWGDMDRYKHINYVAYIRYCSEAAMDACVRNHYTKLTSDILDYQVKSMNIMYKGESVPGEDLSISTWEHEGNPYLLHFDINKDGKTIFQNSVEYFQPQ